VILVAYNGSPEARRALLHAAALVGAGDRLAVVNVIPAQSVSARLETVSDEERKRQESLLADARSLLSDRGVEMQAIAVAGDPVTEIRAAAERSGADILVVGQEHGARHLIHSPVSTRLLRQAPCDVLVVH
jgi:nucleotide-binding universal stress UspA family protein